ncbi:MAG TPA: protease pro-enzyme activation domain-containing protein [Nonomuraea sp.]|nr:protease pro-enzyme activation domain-containing protein [Nonomuraea sp.]
MKRPTALGACLAMAAGSFALTPSAQAAVKQPGIVRAPGAVRAPAASELTASFTLAQTASQKALTRSLAGKRSQGTSTSFAGTQPAAAHRDAVVAWAQSNGFRVVHSSRFLVTVAGPAADLADALGTSLKQAKGYTRSVTPPVVPAALGSHAESVIGVDNRPVFRHHAVYGPADVRAMSNNAVQNSSAGAGVTVGTTNFSGWTRSDLDTFASDPMGPYGAAPALQIAPGQIEEVSVGGANPAVPDGSGGEQEVALDAEAVLAAAPAAKQRLYFGENTGAGSLAIWDKMAADAAAGTLQVVSTSWGVCEAVFTASELNAETSRIDTLIAAGATVFAASGDYGSYDCSYWDPAFPDDSSMVDNTLEVDFPASHPRVVGVGGTSTQPGTTPLTYTHRGWGPGVDTNPDPTTFQGFGAGGGYSTYFPVGPAGQPASTSPGRQVPDIAALADPGTGLVIYTGGYVVAGGTSLASPLSAAGLATVLATKSQIKGIGNILPTLYCRPGMTSDVVSVGQGQYAEGNGFYAVTPGYDHVTGLGVMDWAAFGSSTAALPDPLLTVPTSVRSTTVPLSITGCASDYVSWGAAEGTGTSCAGNAPSRPTSVAISGTQGGHAVTLTALDVNGVCHAVTRPVSLDSVAPVIAGFQATYNGTSTPRYMISWGMTDAAPSSGLYKTHLVLRDNTLGKTVYQWDGGGSSSNHVSVNGVPGHSYTVTNNGYDRAGNVSATVTKAYTMPRDDGSFAFSGFVRQSNGQSYMGSHAVASKAGAYAKFTFTGKQAWLGIIKSRSCGFMDVYVDGVRKRVDLYSASTQFRYPLKILASTTSGTHTVVLKAVGAHRSGSAGNNIYADSLTIAF